MTAILGRTESLLLALETIYLKNYGIQSSPFEFCCTRTKKRGQEAYL